MRIAVIGAGASGLICAGFMAQAGAEVVLIEKNEKLGKKIYITGKGRCNVTNACDEQQFLKNVATNPKFLMSSIYNFNSSATMSFFEENGVKLKVERGERVFPESDKSNDIIQALTRFVKRNGVEIWLNTPCKSVKKQGDFLVELQNGQIEKFDRVVVATGGLSYQATGSTGDGYGIAKSFGHTIITPRPALVGVVTKQNVVSLAGLSLKNVQLSVVCEGKNVYSEFGEMLFTHKGLSGPIVLSASSFINKCNLNNVSLLIDLKPALNANTLDLRLQREFGNIKAIKNVFKELLPKSLIDYFLQYIGIDGELRGCDITKAQRALIVDALKNMQFTIQRLEDINTAIITSGGVSTKEINPKTMESKLCEGLYFVGEVLDVDAFTGGFNLQIAFCTGVTASKFAVNS
ncbi:MAG: NAD(P)/FAD-dependent oxidoreductase [Clostridia bacterium]